MYRQTIYCPVTVMGKLWFNFLSSPAEALASILHVYPSDTPCTPQRHPRGIAGVYMKYLLCVTKV
jgi:hypothetical protein